MCFRVFSLSLYLTHTQKKLTKGSPYRLYLVFLWNSTCSFFTTKQIYIYRAKLIQALEIRGIHGSSSEAIYYDAIAVYSVELSSGRVFEYGLKSVAFRWNAIKRSRVHLRDPTGQLLMHCGIPRFAFILHSLRTMHLIS